MYLSICVSVSLFPKMSYHLLTCLIICLSDFIIGFIICSYIYLSLSLSLCFVLLNTSGLIKNKTKHFLSVLALSVLTWLDLCSSYFYFPISDATLSLLSVAFVSLYVTEGAKMMTVTSPTDQDLPVLPQ